MRVHLLDPEGSRFSRALLDLRQAADAGRPPGLHLSTITDDILKTLYPGDFGKSGTDMEPGTAIGFQEVGNAFEDLIASVFRIRLGWRKPAPKQKDGIWCSPDGVSPGSQTIDEMKVTWKWDTPEFQETGKFKGYTLRCACYCHVWGYRRARIHVWHINGTGRPPIPTWPRTYVVRFGKTELADKWAMVVQHAKDRGLL